MTKNNETSLIQESGLEYFQIDRSNCSFKAAYTASYNSKIQYAN